MTKKDKHESPIWLSVDAAAEKYGYKPSYIRLLKAKGELGYKKLVGGGIEVNGRDLEKRIRKNYSDEEIKQMFPDGDI